MEKHFFAIFVLLLAWNYSFSQIDDYYWEKISSSSFEFINYKTNTTETYVWEIHRAKVHGGWLVASITLLSEISDSSSFRKLSRGKCPKEGIGITFVPDPDYKWQIPRKEGK